MASDFGVRLKELREAAGITQAALAKAVELSRQAISLFEKGESEPSWETVRKIAHALSVSVADFDVKRETQPAKKPASKKPK